MFSFIGWSLRGSFCIVSLVVLLATLTAIPIFQLIAFGYLLSVAGGLASGVSFRDCLPHLRQAGQIGLAALAIFLAALPTQLLSHWESVAHLINPDSNQATAMRVLAITCSARSDPLPVVGLGPWRAIEALSVATAQAIFCARDGVGGLGKARRIDSGSSLPRWSCLATSRSVFAARSGR